MQLKKEKILDILRVTEDINHIKDIDSLLDRVLSEARYFTRADAGSIYLVKEDKLSIEYVQNETLMKRDHSSNRYIYQKQEIIIDQRSLAGYVTLTKRPLAIDDAYCLQNDKPYSFNRSFDLQSSYRTRSILTVPLVTSRDRVIGVMQIINPKDKKNIIRPFTRDHQLLVSYFAFHAAVAIEKAKMTRDMILRMIKMAELRDPKETGAHVNRVGAYSIEIYHKWALDRGILLEKIKKTKDILRIAAMLHDIGKIGISDAILKKTEKLTNPEFNQVKKHTLYGADLFENASSEWEDMTAEVALNHHERWDGNGYPQQVMGEQIPITARIVTLADVYDALVSKRSYKDSWNEKKILAFINQEKGKHFDPSVVDAFFSIYDIIKAIQEKYPL
ncbi:MAG: HD domain-containing protein [Candidatus Aminicenantes bacterium]|nr:HD domain-containing protein [Candidatus Aminicenantes bacterium]